MKILVTGGAGFIGSNFIYFMLDKYKEYEIVCLDKLTYAGNLSTLEKAFKNPRFSFVKGDISDVRFVKSLFEKNNFDIDKVKFFWWEPLLKQNYIKYIVNNFPKKYNPWFYTTTNSTLLNDDFITFIKDNNFKLTFSIDWNAKTTSENRLLINGENLSEKIISNTKKYKDYIRVNQVTTSKNSSNFFKNFKFIYDLWVREFNFLPEYYREWSKTWLQNLKKWFDEILEFRKKEKT